MFKENPLSEFKWRFTWLKLMLGFGDERTFRRWTDHQNGSYLSASLQVQSEAQRSLIQWHKAYTALRDAIVVRRTMGVQIGESIEDCLRRELPGLISEQFPDINREFLTDPDSIFRSVGELYLVKSVQMFVDLADRFREQPERGVLLRNIYTAVASRWDEFSADESNPPEARSVAFRFASKLKEKVKMGDFSFNPDLGDE